MAQEAKSVLKALINLIFSLIVLLFGVFAMPRLIVLFMPIIVGWVISCIANPLVVFLESKIRIRRKAGTVVVIAAVIAIVSALGYMGFSTLFRQLRGFVREMPDMWGSIVDDIDSFGAAAEQYVGNIAPNFAEFISDIGKSIGKAVAELPSKLNFDAFGGMSSMVGNIAGALISTIMAMLSAYFFIAEREWLYEKLEKHMPREFAKKYSVFYMSIKQAVGGYFKAQLRIEAWMYLLMLIGLLVLKVRYALLIALLIAAIDILPFFGSGAVFVPWAIMTALGGNYARALGFLIIWGFSQLFRQLIQPKIMGDTIGMEPIPTIILLFLGFKAAGVMGMLVAVPIGIIAVNMNDAGFFDAPKQSVRILAAAFNKFRKLDEDDLKIFEKDEGK